MHTSILCIQDIQTRRRFKVFSNAYFACNVRATTPDTSGVEALVPVKPSVHLLFRVVVV